VKVKEPDSIETTMFKVLKRIGVELSFYHGGSLNDKDNKKVMNKATYSLTHLLQYFRRGRGPTACCQTKHCCFVSAFQRGVCFMGWDIFASKNYQSRQSRHINLQDVCNGSGARTYRPEMCHHSQSTFDVKAH
jgi:hypothetical protein